MSDYDAMRDAAMRAHGQGQEEGYERGFKAGVEAYVRWRYAESTVLERIVEGALAREYPNQRTLPAVSDDTMCTCGHARENHYNLCSNVRLDACAGSIECQCRGFEENT